MYHTSIQKWGNSCSVRLAKPILDMASLSENEEVQIIASYGQIIIKKREKPQHKTMAERLCGFDKAYGFEECDSGKPIGNEVI